MRPIQRWGLPAALTLGFAGEQAAAEPPAAGVDDVLEDSAVSTLDPVVVTATRTGENNRDLPVANALNLPDSEDPLRLTAAQAQADRRQAQPATLQFRTRRTLENMQGRLQLEQPLTDQLLSGGRSRLSGRDHAGLPLVGSAARTDRCADRPLRGPPPPQIPRRFDDAGVML